MAINYIDDIQTEYRDILSEAFWPVLEKGFHNPSDEDFATDLELYQLACQQETWPTSPPVSPSPSKRRRLQANRRRCNVESELPIVQTDKTLSLRKHTFKRGRAVNPFEGKHRSQTLSKNCRMILHRHYMEYAIIACYGAFIPDFTEITQSKLQEVILQDSKSNIGQNIFSNLFGAVSGYSRDISYVGPVKVDDTFSVLARILGSQRLTTFRDNLLAHQIISPKDSKKKKTEHQNAPVKRRKQNTKTHNK